MALAAPARGAGLRARGAGHHRHQRQDHRHRAHRPAGRARGQDAWPWPATSARRCSTRWPAHIDADTLPEVWVLELSSFQLDGVQGFEPTAATVLNITQDHLDWHGDMAAYAAAKARIFGARRACMVLNRDDAGGAWRMLPRAASAPKLQQAPRCAHAPDLRRRHAAAPRRLRHRGRRRHALAGARAGGRRDAASAARRAPRKRSAHPAPDAGRRAAHPRPAQRPQRAGRAGAGHAPPAARWRPCSRPARVPRRAAPRGAGGDRRRVEYFDDSKGTNVGATVAALTGLGAERRSWW